MQSGDLAELVALRTLARKARLTEEIRHSVLWCLDQLPRLYADFQGTYDIRFTDSIVRLARAALKRLAEPGGGEDAGGVADAVVAQLRGLHQRLGLAQLVLRPAAPGRGHGKRAG